MKKFMGFKLIEAREMTRKEYNDYRGWAIPQNEIPNDDGYLVKYSTTYEAWYPKEVFEKAYLEIADNNTITQKNVDEFIKDIKAETIGEKTTLVTVTLVNGFVLIEASSCVDAVNYNEKIGVEICLQKIKDKIWSYLGFLLQTASKGIK